MTVNVLGVDLELDIYDVDVYEKFEQEVRKVKQRVNNPPKGKVQTNAQALKFQCIVVKDFFDAVFGPGTAEKIFHGKNNIKDCNDAYLAVIEAAGSMMNDYADSMNSRFTEMSAKYSPEDDQPIVYHASPRIIGPIAPAGPNRAQRRNSAKKKKH